MTRQWFKSMSPRQLNSIMKQNTGENLYKGEWMPQMDRCWESNDGYNVMSRLLNTKWGKVEHVTIIKISDSNSSDGSRDIPWRIKQEIKNELFGENRLAIEVFPTDDMLVDECDVYHLWVFDKNFELPFGIHSKQFKMMQYINRGFNFNQAEFNEYCAHKGIKDND